MSHDLIPAHVRVPPTAHYYEPAPFIIFHGKGKNAQRFIFRDQKLSEFENEKLTRLEAELVKFKIDPYALHPNWTRNDVLRFCYGTGWKTRVAREGLAKYIAWHKTLMPNGYLSLFPKIEHLLKSGCLYIHGRDVHFRPIMVLNFNRFDFKKYSVQDHVCMLSFILSYMIENMLLAGRVENWVVISDFEKHGFGDLSLSAIKQVMNVLTDNFRCRLGVNYVVNPSKAVYYTWTCIKPFLDDVLIEKVKILNKQVPDELFTHCNPYQIEEKYGGKAPNISVYWPPHMPVAPYSLDGVPVPFVEEGKNKSFESQILPPSDSEPQYLRRSISINEKMQPSESGVSQDSKGNKKRKSRKRNQKQEAQIEDLVYEEKIPENHIKEVQEAENYKEEHKLTEEEEEIEKQKQAKNDRKKLREHRREMRKKEKELEKQKNIENANDVTPSKDTDNFRDSEADLAINGDLEESPMGFHRLSQGISVENEKQEIGCGICSGFPTITLAGKKCSIF